MLPFIDAFLIRTILYEQQASTLGQIFRLSRKLMGGFKDCFFGKSCLGLSQPF